MATAPQRARGPPVGATVRGLSAEQRRRGANPVERDCALDAVASQRGNVTLHRSSRHLARRGAISKETLPPADFRQCFGIPLWVMSAPLRASSEEEMQIVRLQATGHRLPARLTSRMVAHGKSFRSAGRTSPRSR